MSEGHVYNPNQQQHIPTEQESQLLIPRAGRSDAQIARSLMISRAPAVSSLQGTLEEARRIFALRQEFYATAGLGNTKEAESLARKYLHASPKVRSRMLDVEFATQQENRFSHAQDPSRIDIEQLHAIATDSLTRFLHSSSQQLPVRDDNKYPSYADQLYALVKEQGANPGNIIYQDSSPTST